MSFTVTVAAGLAAATALCLAGCAGFTRVSDQAPPGFSLAGTWKLDPKLSTDTRAALQHALPKQRRKSPSSSDEADADLDESGSDNGSDTENEPAVVRRYRAQIRGNNYPVDISLQRSVLSGGDYLRIEQRPDEFIVWNGDTTSDYTPGEKSVVSVPSGVADQQSGWKGKEYWIAIHPQVGPSVTEKFRLSKDGKQLIETIDIGSDERVSKLDVTRVYDPTHDVPSVVPIGN